VYRRGDLAFGRPCPPEFAERVHDGVVSQRESRTRAVKASREVVCPIPRGGAAPPSSSSPASFSHAAAPGSAPRSTATRLRNAERTRSPAKRPGSVSSRFLRILSPLYGRNCSGMKEREQREYFYFIFSYQYIRYIIYNIYLYMNIQTKNIYIFKKLNFVIVNIIRYPLYDYNL